MGIVAIHEPARNIDQIQKSECVIGIDVLKHVFVLDISVILRDIFSYANRLVIRNIAFYKARALLPSGENAHVTVQDPMWWKSTLDSISTDFPSVTLFYYARLLIGASKFLKTRKLMYGKQALVLRPKCQPQLIQESYQSPKLKF